MKTLHLIAAAAVTLAALAPGIPLPAQAQDAHRLNEVLAQLDAASQHFKNARADVASDNYAAVVKETTTDTGPIYFERSGGSTQMGAVVLDPRSGKPKTIYQYKDGLFEYYEVAANQLHEVKAGGNQGQYESFLTLGFGGSGKDLAKAWNITDLGAETLTDAGQPVKTEKLDLVSKDPGIAKSFTHVTVWIDLQRGVSLRQVFETPSHDKHTATYTHIKLNGKIDTATFAISKKAQRVGN